MRFFHIIVALLILSLLQQCLGISCKDTKGNDVDAWFFFTPPKLVDSKLLVFAQRSNREVDFVGSISANPNGVALATTVENLFLSQVNQANLNNDVTQIWFQNRFTKPDKNVDLTRFFNNDHFRRHNSQFEPSHSKWLFSYDAQSGTGTMIIHSFPEIPHNLDRQEIFDRSYDGLINIQSRFKYAQQGFCFSFTEAELPGIVNAMNRVYPPAVIVNDVARARSLGFEFLWKVQPTYRNKEQVKEKDDVKKDEDYKEQIGELSVTCYTEFVKDGNTKNCIKEENTGSPYIITAMTPLPRITAKKTDPNKETHTDKLAYLGFSLWTAVSASRGDAEFKLFGYPASSDGRYNYLPRQLPQKGSFKRGNVIIVESAKVSRITMQYKDFHTELAFATQSDTVCVGDSGHHVGVTNRAGLASKVLKDTLTKWVTADLPSPVKEQHTYAKNLFETMKKDFFSGARSEKQQTILGMFGRVGQPPAQNTNGVGPPPAQNTNGDQTSSMRQRKATEDINPTPTKKPHIEAIVIEDDQIDPPKQ